MASPAKNIKSSKPTQRILRKDCIIKPQAHPPANRPKLDEAVTARPMKRITRSAVKSAPEPKKICAGAGILSKPQGRKPKSLQSKVKGTQSKSQGIKTKPQDVQSKLQDARSKLQGLKTKPQDEQSKLQDVQSKLQGLKAKPQGVQSKLQDVQSKLQGLKAKPQGVQSKPQGKQSDPQGIQSEPYKNIEPQGIQSVLPLPVYIPVIYETKPGDTEPEEACTGTGLKTDDKQTPLPPPGYLIFITADSNKTAEFILPDTIERDDTIISEDCSTTNPEKNNNTSPEEGNSKNLEDGNTNPKEGNIMNPDEGNNTNIILPRFCIRNQCHQHEALPKQQDEGLPKIGDVFKSPEEFIDYAANKAKDWFFYHTITDSFNPEKAPNFKENNGTFYTFTCKMNLQEQSANTGPKSSVPKKCPSRLALARFSGETDYKVRDVCHHHSHRLTTVFNHHPYFYTVPEDIKQEISDFAQLNVDQRLVLRYITHKLRDLAKDNVDQQMMNFVSRIVPYKISVPEQKVAELVQKYFRVPYKNKTAIKTMPFDKLIEMRAKIEYIKKAFDFSTTTNETEPEVGKLSLKRARVEENSTNVMQLTISYEEEMEHCVDQIEFVDCSNIKQETATTKNTPERVNTNVSMDVGSDSETEDAETDDFATDVEYLDDTIYVDDDESSEPNRTEVPADDDDDDHDSININQVIKTNYESSVKSKYMKKNIPADNGDHYSININQINKTNYKSSVKSKYMVENVNKSPKNTVSLLKLRNKNQRPIYIISDKKTAKSDKKLSESVYSDMTLLSLLKRNDTKEPAYDELAGVKEELARYDQNQIKIEQKTSTDAAAALSKPKDGSKNKIKQVTSTDASVELSKPKEGSKNKIKIEQVTSADAAAELPKPKEGLKNKNKIEHEISKDAAVQLSEPKNDSANKITKTFFEKYAESITSSEKQKKPYAFQYSRCFIHGVLPEYKAEGLPQNGDVFNSKEEFLEYVRRHAKDWHFTYALVDSRATRTIQDINLISSYYMFACKFNRRRRYQEHKYKGLRVHKRRIPDNCPAGLMIKRDRGYVDFTVRQACHHHNHEMTEQLFQTIQSIPLSLRREIADLAKLNVDLGLVRRYIKSKVDLPDKRLTKMVYNHSQTGMRSNKILSPERYKELLEKVKYLKENFGIPIKRRLPTRKTIMENEPRKYRKTKQKMKRKFLTKLLGSVTDFELSEVEDEMDEGIENNRITSKLNYKKISEPVKVSSGSRVEARLNNLMNDRELIQSVREMQKRTGCIVHITDNGGAHLIQNQIPEIQYEQFADTAEQIEIDQEVHIMDENDIITDENLKSEFLVDHLTKGCEQQIIYQLDVPKTCNKKVKQNIELSLKSKLNEDNYEDTQGIESVQTEEYVEYIQDIKSVELETEDYVEDTHGTESVQTEEYVEYIHDLESVHNEDYVEDIQDIESVHNEDYVEGIEPVNNEEYIEDIESVHNEEYVEDIESVHTEEYVEDIESVHNVEYVEDIESVHNVEYVEDIESVHNEKHVEAIESVKTKENVEAEQDIQALKTIEYVEKAVHDIESAKTVEYVEQSNYENNENANEIFEENSEEYQMMYEYTNDEDEENVDSEKQGVENVHGGQSDSLGTSLKETEVQPDTSIDFTREAETFKELESKFVNEHAGNIEFSASTRGRPKVLLDEAIINRYNIEFYISLGGVITCIDHLAANMGIPALELLKHVYQGKAVLKMVTGRTGNMNRKTVHLTFVPLTMAFPFENKFINGLKEYKSLCSKYSDVVVGLENTINSMSTELSTLKEELNTAKEENERLSKLVEEPVKKQTSDDEADKKRIKKLEQVICLMVNRFKSNSSVMYV